jgi:hypothetical protein
MESQTPTGATAYPVQFSVDYPDRDLNRLTTAFRIFMAIPIVIVLATLGHEGGASWGGEQWRWGASTGGLLFLAPLLNDFIGLQKDTALVSVLGVVEALRQTQINEAATFNGTYYLVAATLFVALTIPLARVTDWLVARERRRREAGGGVR